MISSLGYLRIESADRGAWREFGVKILGMTEGRGPEAGALYLRMDDFPARLVIMPGSAGPAARLRLGGRRRRGAGRRRPRPGRRRRPYKAGTDAELAARRVGVDAQPGGPGGPRPRGVLRRRARHRPSVSPYGNRFVTGDLGLGHVVLPVPPGDEAAFDFYTEVLGFRLRDSMRMPAEFFGGKPGDPPVWFRFLGCNAAAPLAGPGPGARRGRHRAPDDRDRVAGRRGPGAGPVRPARRDGIGLRWGGTPTT